jgi:histone-lysine N-methyltransferase SETMAR
LVPGEVIGDKEAECRNVDDGANGRHNFIYWVREHFGGSVTTTVVDPTAIGNIGRYLNHSCGPNLAVHPVRVDCLVPRVALFAARDIGAGQGQI